MKNKKLSSGSPAISPTLSSSFFTKILNEYSVFRVFSPHLLQVTAIWILKPLIHWTCSCQGNYNLVTKFTGQFSVIMSLLWLTREPFLLALLKSSPCEYWGPWSFVLNLLLISMVCLNNVIPSHGFTNSPMVSSKSTPFWLRPHSGTPA